MIVKHVPMLATKKSNFSNLVNYITGEQNKDHRIGNVQITNCETNNLKAATAEILATQFGNTRASNDKTYHLLLSFRAGENPSVDILNKIEDRLCASLGFSDHQRISAVHNDTDNLHIHIAINKIHPERKTIHEPFRAYKTLANLSVILESEFNLERDNHTSKKSLSEGRVNDMEKHSGIESLVTWIRKECLDGIRSASSWGELHTYLAENGLKLKEQGAGLVLESDELKVKPSTVARDISKNGLEDRLGAFTGSDGKATKAKQRYLKKPIKKRVDTTELYSKYKEAKKNIGAERLNELKRLRIKKDRKIVATKRSNKLRRTAIRITDSKGINKKLVYAQAHSALQSAIKKINNDFKYDKDNLYKTHRQLTWADWLKQQAEGGDLVALEAMRARESAQSLKGNLIGSLGGDSKMGSLKVDSITKKGTVIYRAGRNAIRDDGKQLQISKGADAVGIEAALKLAVEKYGPRLSINGSPEFKAQVIDVVTKTNLSITFTDASLERMRQQHATKEKNYDQTIRRRLDSRSTGIYGSRGTTDNNQRSATSNNGQRGTGLFSGLRKPNIKSIGTNPPPCFQNRLRRLSELGVVHISSRSEVLLQGNVPRNVEQQRTKSADLMRRDVSGSRPGITKEHITAVSKYITEREKKRENGFDISNHYMYNAEKGSLSFTGLRKVDNFDMVLLKDEKGSVGVYPIDQANAKILKRLKIGESVTLSNKGAIKRIRKGRNR